MAKIKPIYLIIGAIALFLVLKGQTGFLGAAADVGSATVDRSMATSVKDGSTFDITYTASGMGAGSYGVLIEDIVSGGCTFNGVTTPTQLNTGWISPQTTYMATLTASGTSCSFVGDYEFGGGTLQTIGGTTSISVCTDECTADGCVDTSTAYTCADTDADVCLDQTNVPCDPMQECQSGSCVYICNDLRTEALTTITAWAADPISSKKTDALNAIVLWATNC